MENKIKEIVLKSFNENEIESVKVFKGRAIVTLKNVGGNKEKEDTIRKEIEKIKDIEKVSIVYTGDKQAPKLDPNDGTWKISQVKKIIAVASGKGGVGKSTTSVNLALALANQNKKVALFDADIYGPSISTMLGYADTPPATFDGKRFEPFYHMSIKSMSIGSLLDKSQPLVWRGAKVCQAIEQLITETNWGEIDIMVIDMPPGTGDTQITLSQRLKLDGAVIVSTPQDIALIDAVKGVNMFKMVNVSILGVIENMSYYICEKCGERAEIFGHKGAKETADKIGVDFLGEIPLHIKIRENADNGTPIVFAEPESPHTKAYEEIAKKIIDKMG